MPNRIIKSTNYGYDWEILVSDTSEYKIRFLSFLNEEIGYASHWAGSVIESTLKTQDGGKTWKLPSQDQKIVFQSCIGEIILNNRLFFITTGPSGSYLSEKGNIWKKISTSGYHCLSVSPDKKTVWFAGSKGRLGILNLK